MRKVNGYERIQIRFIDVDDDMSTPRLTKRERARNRRAEETEEAWEQRLVRDRARKRQRLAL